MNISNRKLIFVHQPIAILFVLLSLPFTVLGWQTEDEKWTGLEASSTVNVLTTQNNELFVGGSFQTIEGIDASRIARYNVASETWHALGEGVNNIVRAIAVDGNNVYVGGGFSIAGEVSANRIARYDLNSNTWHNFGSGLLGGINASRVSAIAVIGDNIFVGGSFNDAGGEEANNIARYNTESESWHAIGDGVNGRVEAFAVLGNSLFVGGEFTSANGVSSTSYIARYDIQDDSWHSLSANNTINSPVYALAINEENLYVGGAFTGHTRITRYNFSEESWIRMAEGSSWTVSAVAIVAGKVYAGGIYGDSDRIARYNSEEDTWEALGSGVDNNINAISGAGQHLYVAGSFNNAGGKSASRLAKYDLGIPVSNEDKPLVPLSFQLNQNYPNPFNPSTVISYQLPVHSEVKLQVFDMLGREVATLVDEPKSTGYHSATFNAGNLASGMYIYQLKVGNSIFTKKLSLIK